MTIDQWAVDDLDVVVRSAALEQHVLAARGDQCQAGNHPVIVLGFAHFYLRQRIQARSE
ncbi:hypothetical protein D3C76_1539470 [compost metagenome]